LAFVPASGAGPPVTGASGAGPPVTGIEPDSEDKFSVCVTELTTAVPSTTAENFFCPQFTIAKLHVTEAKIKSILFFCFISSPVELGRCELRTKFSAARPIYICLKFVEVEIFFALRTTSTVFTSNAVL
jgi:hypothetical protein